MANFYMTLPADEIARQVAELLNNHNLLRKHHSINTIMKGKAAYFVDIVGGRVIGCSAIHRETEEVTKQFHLCVHPNFRRQGLGRKLKLASLAHITTPYVYVTIREDNIPSINLNTSLGFVFVKKGWVKDHNVLTLGRITINDRPGPTRLDGEEYKQADTSFIDTTNLFYTGV